MDDKKKKKKSNKKKDILKNEEKYLYKTTTIIDINEFKKFQKFYLNKFKNSIVPKIIMIVLALLAIVLNLHKGNLDIVLLVIIFIIIYPIVLNFTLNRQIKKMYNTNKRINMLEETITFYNNYLESRSEHNYCKVQYNDIYKVCETKTNFYIFLSDNQVFIVIKDSIKDLDSFKEFISSKATYKKYR